MGLTKKKGKKAQDLQKNKAFFAIFATMERKKNKRISSTTLVAGNSQFFKDPNDVQAEGTSVVRDYRQNISATNMESSTPLKTTVPLNKFRQLRIISFESSEEEDSATEEEIAEISLPKLLDPENALQLSVFINFTLVHSHAEQIFFYLLTNLYKDGYLYDMQRWAYEIYSSFIVSDAPLQIFSPNIQAIVSADIDAKLSKAKNLSETENSKMYRELFNRARFESMQLIREQLAKFQKKRRAGLATLYEGTYSSASPASKVDKLSEQKKIEKNIMPKFLMMLDELEESGGKNEKLQLLLSSLATIIHQIFNPRNIHNEPIDQFVSSERLNMKVIESNGHQLIPKICHSITYCDFCLKILFGIAPQGFECECGIKVHRSCIKLLKGTCINVTSNAHNESRDSTKLYELVHNALGNRHIENYKRCKTNRPKSDPGLYDKNVDSSSDDNTFDENHWTSTISMELQNLPDIAKKRREILKEIFETEIRHVKVLKLLQNVFLEPLKRSKALSIELANQLFPMSFFVIKDWHFSFEAMLKKESYEQQGMFLAVGGCLAIFEDSYGEILRENAANFCAGQQAALELLREQRSKSEVLQRALIKAEGHKRCKRLQLKDLMMIILQRLTKYPLLFERLAKYSEGSELVKVQKAFESSKMILNYVNQAVRNYEELRLIHRKLVIDKDASSELNFFNLLSLKLIHDGYLTLKKGAIPLKVLLFERYIVFLHKIDDKFILRSCENLKIPIVNLSNAFVRSNAANNRSFFLIIQNEQLPQMLELISASDDECTGWTKKLIDAIENANKASQRKYLNESAQIILRSDSKNHLDMSKSVDLATIGQALIIQTKHIEDCFQNSLKSSLKNSEQSKSEDTTVDFTMSINTLNRLVSQLTMKIAERDHERELYLKENQKLRDNVQS